MSTGTGQPAAYLRYKDVNTNTHVLQIILSSRANVLYHHVSVALLPEYEELEAVTMVKQCPSVRCRAETRAQSAPRPAPPVKIRDLLEPSDRGATVRVKL